MGILGKWGYVMLGYGVDQRKMFLLAPVKRLFDLEVACCEKASWCPWVKTPNRLWRFGGRYAPCKNCGSRQEGGPQKESCLPIPSNQQIGVELGPRDGPVASHGFLSSKRGSPQTKKANNTRGQTKKETKEEARNMPRHEVARAPFCCEWAKRVGYTIWRSLSSGWLGARGVRQHQVRRQCHHAAFLAKRPLAQVVALLKPTSARWYGASTHLMSSTSGKMGQTLSKCELKPGPCLTPAQANRVQQGERWPAVALFDRDRPSRASCFCPVPPIALVQQETIYVERHSRTYLSWLAFPAHSVPEKLRRVCEFWAGGSRSVLAPSVALLCEDPCNLDMKFVPESLGLVRFPVCGCIST